MLIFSAHFETRRQKYYDDVRRFLGQCDSGTLDEIKKKNHQIRINSPISSYFIPCHCTANCVHLGHKLSIHHIQFTSIHHSNDQSNEWCIKLFELFKCSFELMRIIIHHFEFASIRSATWRLGRKLLSRWTTSACGVYGGLTDCLVCHGEIHGNPSRESMSSTGLSFLKMGCILNVHGIL